MECSTIGVLLAVILLMESNGATIAILPQFTEEQSYENCPRKVVKNILGKDLTVVNFGNDSFIKVLHSLPIKTLIRTSLAMKLDEPNEAYLVQCTDLSECEKGFEDLIKDKYWNPYATFVIITRNFTSGPEQLFKILHHLYVFKAVVVLYDHIYLYNFRVADHCTFTPNAIREFNCGIVTSDFDSNVWLDIKGFLLEEKSRKPYSECTLSVIIGILVPFVFPPLEVTAVPTGFEEEFIAILNRMNFSRITFSYNMNMTGTGTVFDNFTVTGMLRDVHTGAVDYVMGGSLLSHFRLNVFEFTYPHWCDDFLLIVPKARQIDKWEAMYTVFNPVVWALIVLAFVCVAIVAFITKLNGERDLHALVLITLDLYGYFTNNCSKKSASYFLLTWALFTWLITCFYQCNLTSIFTKPIYYKDINSLEEIVKHNYKFYLTRAKYNYMKGSSELDMGGLIRKSIIRKTDLECLESVAYKRQRFTLISRLSYIYFKSKFRNNDGEDLLHRVVEPYSYIFTTGYLKKGNPNLKRIRSLEQRIIAFGLHRRSLLTYIHMRNLKYYKDKKSRSKPLTCNDIAGLYYIYLSGCGISLITFFIEHVLNK